MQKTRSLFIEMNFHIPNTIIEHVREIHVRNGELVVRLYTIERGTKRITNHEYLTYPMTQIKEFHYE